MRIASDIRRSEFKDCILKANENHYLYHADLISVHAFNSIGYDGEQDRKLVCGEQETVPNRVLSDNESAPVGEGNEISLNDQIRIWYQEGISKNKILKRLKWKISRQDALRKLNAILNNE
jgi:hypothetical protein